MSKIQYDILIIGSGAAGCVVADHMARHTKASIAVLEAGKKDNDPFIHIPAGYSKMLAKDRNVWPYETVEVNGQNRRYRMGKVVGGGTSVNAIAAYVKGDIGYQSAAQGMGTIKAGLRYILTNSGPAAGNGIETVSYWDPNDLSNPQPTVQCYHEPIISTDGLNPSGPRSGVTFATVVLQPKARGWVRLADADPTSMPDINPNFIGHETDLQVGIDAVKAVRKVLEQQSLAEVFEEEFVPGKAVQTDEEIGAFVKQVATTMWHPVGTCRMGTDDTAVVDATLKVRGAQGLHVIDASIMPTITSGNTNAPTQALALHAAKMLVRDYFA
ncbi:hypothetical protein BFP70_08980 [Thioclava sp. SK-1]|uniref:GMC family oxidoreductase n=1 Tax=Thioclava sp. SK-1 TaxID=1889770 RepID=UPI0008249480|nr:GMC oxidoreductase [Thioclava sp. SK-1]OCX65612.1 hypothetical protein BFP70_08980 [Thioclava sp. SK-1]